MPIQKYYPPLTELLDASKIPGNWKLIEHLADSAINTIFGKVYYKDFSTQVFGDGDKRHYRVVLLTKNLGVPLPGDLELVFFKSTDPNLSEFPILFEWNWPLSKYIKQFEIAGFSYAPEAFLDILIELAEIRDREEFFSKIIDTFLGDGSDAYVSFFTEISTIISAYNNGDPAIATEINEITSNLTIIKNEVQSILASTNLFKLKDLFERYKSNTVLSTAVDGIKTSIETLKDLGISIDTYVDTLKALIINLADDDEKFDRLFALFQGWIEDITLDDLKAFLIPRFKIELEDINAALEFPRTMLTPLDSSNQVLDEPEKSAITFTAGSLALDSVNGVELDLDPVLALSKSRIGNTPLILEASGIKLDLSTDSNIPEATADGRTDAFKGVYIEEATIGLLLDSGKFPDGTSVELYSKNLLIGNEGGISGTVGIKATTITHPQYWSSLIIDPITPNISYDHTTQEVTIVGDKQIDGSVLTGESEVVLMDPSDTMDIRDANNKYYRVVRASSSITVSSITPSFSPLSIKFGGTGTGAEADANVLTLDTFSVTFHQNKIVASDIEGTLYLPKVGSGGTTIDIDVNIENGFHVTFKADPALEITNNSIFGLTVDFLQIQDTEEFFQIALGDAVIPELGGTLTNNVDIPFANKFVPRTFQFDYLAWKKYKSSFSGDDQGFNYSLLLTWDNGLSIPISNLGTAISQVEFRKRFEIEKKKEDGFFKLEAIELVIKPETPDGVSAAAELYGAQFNFGKSISFTIDGLGLKTILSEAADNKGDIGPFDLDFQITGPSGIGVSIDAGAVKGTGYLYISEDEYRGLVQLEVSEKFTITAIALLNTKMPDGSKGNSFITIVSITGLNIQLGMGFVLDGLGGILGIHRTMDTQFLRDNIRNGTMDSLMFPDLQNTPLSQVISDLKSVYPMKRDQFIFGPMAKLFWGGVKSIVEADLALLIEFSDPTRLIILGKAGIAIGVDGFDILSLNVGVLIELNFTEKRLMMDASIYDSKLLFFTLEGDMALRLFWGDNKAFLLTVGGFHPDYTPEANMLVNNVRRMRISLLNDNPRLTVETYFAVTSNTVQFGAAVDFYFGIKGFAVKGGFGFDCLFQFNPFQFTVGVHASLGVYSGSKELMGISLKGTLKGPTPWSISGSVKFKVLFIKVKGRVDKTWGDNKNTSLPAVAVLPLVAEALADDKNWETRLPASNYFLVGLNENSQVAEDAMGNPLLLMNPMSTLTVKQDVVPLGIKLEHYYNQKVSGADTFNIDSIVLGANDATPAVFTNFTYTKTDFAPAQYFVYSDKQKLQKSSFEILKNGASLTASGELELKHFVEMDYNYDMTLYDGKPVDPMEPLLWDNFRVLESELVSDFMAVDQFVKGGFIANNSQSKRNKFNKEKVAGNVVHTVDDFVIVNKNTFAAHDGDEATYSSENRSSAEDLMRIVMDGNPDLEGELMVVQKHEII